VNDVVLAGGGNRTVVVVPLRGEVVVAMRGILKLVVVSI